MPSSFAVRTGLLKLRRTPSARDLATRRRLIAIGGLLAVGLAIGVVGTLSAPHDSAPASVAGPFSYFPTQ